MACQPQPRRQQRCALPGSRCREPCKSCLPRGAALGAAVVAARAAALEQVAKKAAPRTAAKHPQAAPVVLSRRAIGQRLARRAALPRLLLLALTRSRRTLSNNSRGQPLPPRRRGGSGRSGALRGQRLPRLPKAAAKTDVAATRQQMKLLARIAAAAPQAPGRLRPAGTPGRDLPLPLPLAALRVAARRRRPLPRPQVATLHLPA